MGYIIHRGRVAQGWAGGEKHNDTQVGVKADLSITSMDALKWMHSDQSTCFDHGNSVG